MTDLERILDQYIDAYIEESDTLFNKAEIYKYNHHLIPIKEGETIIGMVGLDIFPVAKLNERMPVVRLIYIAPEHRKPKSFKTAIRDIMVSLKEQGFKTVEVVINNKINNWFRRELHSKPRSYSHVQELDFFIKQLVED